jgi:hypothetical protein
MQQKEKEANYLTNGAVRIEDNHQIYAPRYGLYKVRLIVTPATQVHRTHKRIKAI